MLGVDAAGDQILHYAENAAAGMQKEGLSFGMDQVNDMPVLRKNVGADIITRQQGYCFYTQDHRRSAAGSRYL